MRAPLFAALSAGHTHPIPVTLRPHVGDVAIAECGWRIAEGRHPFRGRLAFAHKCPRTLWGLSPYPSEPPTRLSKR